MITMIVNIINMSDQMKRGLVCIIVIANETVPDIFSLLWLAFPSFTVSINYILEESKRSSKLRGKHGRARRQ